MRTRMYQYRRDQNQEEPEGVGRQMSDSPLNSIIRAKYARR
jgi:hypothetical protein